MKALQPCSSDHPSLKDYLENPCGTLSIPFWKSEILTLPENMRIIHDAKFDTSLLESFEDAVYFRLIHRLNLSCANTPASHHAIVEISPDRFPDLVNLINTSYQHIGIKVTLEQVKEWTQSPVYAPHLWVGILSDNQLIGAIIADFHTEAKEGIIEWLQVHPEHHGKGIGAALLHNCLWRMASCADFATVSGLASNVTNPESLYRKCGFTGQDYWHILTRK